MCLCLLPSFRAGRRYFLSLIPPSCIPLGGSTPSHSHLAGSPQCHTLLNRPLPLQFPAADADAAHEARVRGAKWAGLPLCMAWHSMACHQPALANAVYWQARRAHAWPRHLPRFWRLDVGSSGMGSLHMLRDTAAWCALAGGPGSGRPKGTPTCRWPTALQLPPHRAPQLIGSPILLSEEPQAHPQSPPALLPSDAAVHTQQGCQLVMMTAHIARNSTIGCQVCSPVSGRQAWRGAPHRLGKLSTLLISLLRQT